MTTSNSSAPLIVAALGLVAACSASAPHVDRTQVEAFPANGGNASSRIAVESSPGHPRLALVRRDGDATPGVAVVARVAGAREALSLATLLELRLREAGLHPDKRVYGTSFSLRFFTDSADTVLGPIHEAFAKPIAASEMARVDAALEATRVPLSAPFLGGTDDCEEALALGRGWKHLGQGELEAARTSAFGVAPLVIGAVGPDAFLAKTTDALAHSATYPSGKAREDAPWPKHRTATAGRLDETPEGRTEVRIAIALADPRAAVSAAKSFEHSGLPALRSKLLRLATPFAVDRINGNARGRGGCFSLRMHTNANVVGDAAADAVTKALAIAEDDAMHAATGASRPEIAEANVLEASDPVDAAELAAWWTQAESVAGATPEAAVAVALAPSISDASLASVERAAAVAPTASAGGIDLTTRAENGQGALWVLVANPCVGTLEPAHEWGASAAAVMARSIDASDDGIVVEPLIAPVAMGVLAHATAAPGESPDDLARRVADRAAKALLGGPPSPEGLGGATATARRTLERDWGRAASGLDLLAADVAPDHPALLEPLGSLATMTRTDMSRATAAWQVVARGPLRIVVLENEAPTQGQAALEAARRWVLPTANAADAKRCPAVTEPRAGHDVAHADDTDPRALARSLIALPLGKGPEGRAMGGVLAAMFSGTGPLQGIDQARVTARVVGTPPLLVLDVQAPDEHLTDAEKAAIDALLRAGTAELPEDVVRRALDEGLAAEQRRWADPRERVLALVTGGDNPPGAPHPIDSATFRAWARGTVTEAHLAVVEVRR